MRKRKESFLDQIMAYFEVIIFFRAFKILYLENSDKRMRSINHICMKDLWLLLSLWE